MPADSKPRLALQPNPFGSASTGSPWAGGLADIPSINEQPFRLIIRALEQMRMGAKGTSVVLVGEPGSGKTHLLARVRNRLRQLALGGKGASVYVYLRCNASAGTLWRHLRHALASDLLKGTDESQLHDLFRDNPARLDNVKHGAVRRVLECLRDGRHFHTASAWLRGELLGEADLAALGLAIDKDDEERSRERDAKLVIDALLDFIAPTPVILCFDQVEAMEVYRGEEAGYQTMAQMISALNDGHENLLLVSCIVSAFEDRFDRLPNGADRDRWLQLKAVLRPIGWEQARELVKARLDAAPALQSARLAHPANDLWPLDPTAVQALFGTTGLCLPRTLIRFCEQQFAELLGDDEPAPPPKDRETFLQEEYDRALTDARKITAKQALGKTLSDCLPWLLQNSKLIPLGHDEARSRYANQAWRGPDCDTALAFCDSGGNALTHQLRRIDREWTPKSINLAIFRDTAIQPGAKGLELLRDLKQRGAKEISPLPEALAVLQAIRNLTATARSGELFLGNDYISEQTVTEWALANLSPQAEDLRAALISKKPAPADPVLPLLSTLLNERKILPAEAAAAELHLTSEEVTNCARLHSLRFGLLDGPPVVIFQAAEGPAR